MKKAVYSVIALSVLFGSQAFAKKDNSFDLNLKANVSQVCAMTYEGATELDFGESPASGESHEVMFNVRCNSGDVSLNWVSSEKGLKSGEDVIPYTFSLISTDLEIDRLVEYKGVGVSTSHPVQDFDESITLSKSPKLATGSSVTAKFETTTDAIYSGDYKDTFTLAMKAE